MLGYRGSTVRTNNFPTGQAQAGTTVQQLLCARSEGRGDILGET